MSAAFFAFCAFFKTPPSCAKLDCARRVVPRSPRRIRVSFMASPSLWFLRGRVGIEAAVLQELQQVCRSYGDLGDLLRFDGVGRSSCRGEHGFLNLSVRVHSVEAERRAVFRLPRGLETDGAAEKGSRFVAAGLIARRRRIVWRSIAWRRSAALFRILSFRTVVGIAVLVCVF